MCSQNPPRRVEPGAKVETRSRSNSKHLLHPIFDLNLWLWATAEYGRREVTIQEEMRFRTSVDGSAQPLATYVVVVGE